MKELKLRELPLSRGNHKSPEEGVCIMEVVSYVAGEPFSDHPQCACPIISAFLRGWNDGMNDTDRQILKPLVPLLIGSRSTSEVECRRLNMIVDWCCAVSAPEWLDMAGLHKEAEEGRNLGKEANWQKIRQSAAAASDSAYATAAAAAYAAASYATTAATSTSYAATAATSYAATAAAYAATAYNSAASYASVLHPTVVKIQKRAMKLIADCLAIKE